MTVKPVGQTPQVHVHQRCSCSEVTRLKAQSDAERHEDSVTDFVRSLRG